MMICVSQRSWGCMGSGRARDGCIKELVSGFSDIRIWVRRRTCGDLITTLGKHHLQRRDALLGFSCPDPTAAACRPLSETGGHIQFKDNCPRLASPHLTHQWHIGPDQAIPHCPQRTSQTWYICTHTSDLHVQAWSSGTSWSLFHPKEFKKG